MTKHTEELILQDNCDSISILDNVINDILHDPDIFGYSKKPIDMKYNMVFPINFITIAIDIVKDYNVEILYYDENTQMSTLSLGGRDIVFKKIEFNNNFSELNVIVHFIGDKGAETIRSFFTYDINMEKCLWTLNKSNYMIIN